MLELPEGRDGSGHKGVFQREREGGGGQLALSPTAYQELLKY